MSATTDRDQLSVRLVEAVIARNKTLTGECVADRVSGAVDLSRLLADAVWAAGWRPAAPTETPDELEVRTDAPTEVLDAEFLRDKPVIGDFAEMRDCWGAPVVGDAGPPPTDDELRSDDDERQADIQRDTQRGW